MEFKWFLSVMTMLHGYKPVPMYGTGHTWKRRLSLIQYMAIFISLFVLSARIHNSQRKSNTPQEVIFQLIYEDMKLHLSCWVTALLCYHIVLRSPADSHTFKSLITQYIVTSILQLLGSIGAYFFQKSCLNCRDSQEKILKTIITRGLNTQYGCDFKLADLDSVEKFRKTHPLTTYDHYKKYFEACIEGKHNVMFPGATDYIGTTSGTTSGSCKEFPRNKKFLMRCYMQSFITCLYHNFRSELKDLQLWPQIFLKPVIKYNSRGTARGSFSAFFKRMSHSTSPAAVYDIRNDQSALYVHAIFALRERSSRALFLQIAPIALSFFKIIEHKWEDLCIDIETGSINKDIELTKEIQHELEAALTPDFSRAEELRSIFERGFKDLVPRVWPNCSKITTLSSASFATQSSIVKKEYSGNIPIVSNIHMATETVYGIQGAYKNLPNEYEYVFTINGNFFEFIPISQIEEDQPETLLAHELEIGARYEIVVTTREGLYRYRSEDIIQVTGFHGSTPKYILLHRTGEFLNARTEKVREEMISKALKRTASTWNLGLIANYTSTENIHVEQVQNSISGLLHYIIFIELVEDHNTAKEHTLKVDKELMNSTDSYKNGRLSNSIQPLCIYQVKRGTFDKLRELSLQTNIELSFGQYKYPRITRKADKISLLLENLVK